MAATEDDSNATGSESHNTPPNAPELVPLNGPINQDALIQEMKAGAAPLVRIIPIVLSIFGYTYGSLLCVFFAGMLTKNRGNNFGNILAMILGFVVVAVLSGLPNKIASLFGTKFYEQPGWLPEMEFPWWIFFGTIVTFLVAILFKSRPHIRPIAS